jgi:hypothetical protein
VGVLAGGVELAAGTAVDVAPMLPLPLHT